MQRCRAARVFSGACRASPRWTMTWNTRGGCTGSKNGKLAALLSQDQAASRKKTRNRIQTRERITIFGKTVPIRTLFSAARQAVFVSAGTLALEDHGWVKIFFFQTS